MTVLSKSSMTLQVRKDLIPCLPAWAANISTVARAAASSRPLIPLSSSVRPHRWRFRKSTKQIHAFLEVTGNGTPPLVGYQRVICFIK
jgi:hypothetical protein